MITCFFWFQPWRSAKIHVILLWKECFHRTIQILGSCQRQNIKLFSVRMLILSWKSLVFESDTNFHNSHYQQKCSVYFEVTKSLVDYNKHLSSIKNNWNKFSREFFFNLTSVFSQLSKKTFFFQLWRTMYQINISTYWY